MRRTLSVAILFLAAMCLLHLPASSAPPPPEPLAVLSPAEVAERVFRAVESGQIEDAIRLTATFPAIPPQAMAELYSQHADAPRTSPRTIAHLQLGDAAIVIVHDSSQTKSTIDLDPAYLIRRNDRWLVLPRLTKYDRKQFQFDEPTLRRFAQLETWYRSQKPELAALLRTVQ